MEKSEDRSLVLSICEAGRKVGLNLEPSLMPFWTDGAIFKKVGYNVGIIGAGPMETAHTDQEKVEKSQLVKLTELYLALCLR